MRLDNNQQPRYATPLGVVPKFQNARFLKQLVRRHDRRLPVRPPQAGLLSRQQAAIALLESWMAEDAAMLPDEQQHSLVEWEHLQQLLAEESLADAPLLP